MGKRIRWVGLPFLVVFFMLAGARGTAWAECGTCQVCREKTRLTIPADYCAVANDEAGYTCCTPSSIGIATYCSESGSACYGIVVGGGGGGGGTGGGGGGGCGYQSGWCPAECMTCGGTKY